jgi:hypothetical protein
MNERRGEKMNIHLRELMDGPDGWGRIQGRQVYEQLRSQVETNSAEMIIKISLQGVERTDILFPRESVIALAREYRGTRGFCLREVHHPDLLENWDAAAERREQPLMVWNGNQLIRVLGPELSPGLRHMFDYVLSRPVARTSEAAASLGLKVPNASNKLKQLWQEGYILRREQSASSGGVEYEYLRIA